MGSKPPCGSTAACPQQNCAQTKVINCWCQPKADMTILHMGGEWYFTVSRRIFESDGEADIRLTKLSRLLQWGTMLAI